MWKTGGMIRDEQSTGLPHARRYGEIHGLSTRSPAAAPFAGKGSHNRQVPGASRFPICEEDQPNIVQEEGGKQLKTIL